MNNKRRCPVCLNDEGGRCEASTGAPNPLFKCDICGHYIVNYEIFTTDGADLGLDKMQRAVLSHRIRTKSGRAPKTESEPFTVTPDVLESLRSDGKLPSPAIQAANLIRFIGDEVSRSGEDISVLPDYIHANIGALNRKATIQLANELDSRRILRLGYRGKLAIDGSGSSGPQAINLTLDGWEQYEAEKRGRLKTKYGFIAMQFNDPKLDTFVREVVKPAVEDGIGYELVDMRDVAQAGIIDNIMRIRIRDAAFVIADLTHDNRGAYWEAGYAEGLGKPVIYICEKEKFESASEKPHFDTNHCTTVPWSRDNDKGFCKELIATLHRSLDLSP